MTTKRTIIGNTAPAYENRLDRDPKSKTFGKKLHYPLHADGSVSGEGYRKASDALSAHKWLVTKADDMAHAEGYSSHDEGLDIQSNPYTGRIGRAWADGWKRADSDGEELAREAMGDEEEACACGSADHTSEDHQPLEDVTDRDLIGDVNPVVDEAQV